MNTFVRRYLALPLFTLLAVLLLTGCAGQRQPIQDPTFRLAGVEPLALGLTEQQFRLIIRVDNPNDLSLPVQSLRYNLQLAGIDFASGLTSKSFTLPARDSTTFEVDVTTNLMSSLPRLLPLIDGSAGAVGYALSGDVEYGRIFRGNRAFEQKGQIRFTP